MGFCLLCVVRLGRELLTHSGPFLCGLILWKGWAEVKRRVRFMGALIFGLACSLMSDPAVAFISALPRRRPSPPLPLLSPRERRGKRGSSLGSFSPLALGERGAGGVRGRRRGDAENEATAASETGGRQGPYNSKANTSASDPSR